MTRYLTIVELIIINEELIGGQSRTRDVDLLESAVLRPQSSAFGQDAYPTIPAKAASIFHSLARNHAFMDGNKRTATLATLLFLKMNGYKVTWDDEEALAFILNVATGNHDVEAVTRWLEEHTTPVEPESFSL